MPLTVGSDDVLLAPYFPSGAPQTFLECRRGRGVDVEFDESRRSSQRVLDPYVFEVDPRVGDVDEETSEFAWSVSDCHGDDDIRHGRGAMLSRHTPVT